MKKLLVLMLVLGIASMASAAAIKISVNGVCDPEDTTITLKPSETAIIDLHVTDNANWKPGGQGFYLILQGPGSIVADSDPLAQNPQYRWQQSLADNLERPEPYDTLVGILGTLGYTQIVDIVGGDIKDASEPFDIPSGKVIDGMIFHCLDEGDVTLTLITDAGDVLDTQIIHQVPEPLTVALLGLGGLFLRRRK